MKIKKLIIIASTLFLASCTNPSTNQNEIQTGTKVDSKYLISFLPKLKQGIKYAYLSIERKGTSQNSSRIEIDVLNVNDNKVKLKTSIAGNAQNDSEIDLNSPPIFPTSGILFLSKESLTVPSGTYLTSRFSYLQNNSNFNVWLSTDVGIIRLQEQKNNGDIITTELNEIRF